MEKKGFSKLHLQNFTAFKDLEIDFSPGINIFIGENGTGKTHLLKVLYAAGYISGKEDLPANHLDSKLLGVFKPYRNMIGRLINNKSKADAKIDLESDGIQSSFTIIRETSRKDGSCLIGHDGFNWWREIRIDAAMIPAKEPFFMPNLASLHKERILRISEIYPDILSKAQLPHLRSEKIEDSRLQRILKKIQKTIGGEVILKGDEFFIQKPDQDFEEALEFSLLAEGWRKIALLWLLIKNGSIRPGSVLLWDEPETNLNPGIMRKVIEILLDLQRASVQIFISTHNYVILKEFELSKKKTDKVRFHSLYRNKKKDIVCHSTDDFYDIEPNKIGETFIDLYERDLDRDLKLEDDDA